MSSTVSDHDIAFYRDTKDFKEYVEKIIDVLTGPQINFLRDQLTGTSLTVADGSVSVRDMLLIRIK